MKALTIQIPDETAIGLDEIAVKLGRSSTDLVAEAIDDYLSWEAWQIAEIEAGISAADRGDFASDAELAAVFSTYMKSAFAGPQ